MSFRERLGFPGKQVNNKDKEQKVVSPKEQRQEELARRHLERQQQVANIETKLANGYEVIKAGDTIKKMKPESILSQEPDGSMVIALSDRQRARLEIELSLLSTYVDRHPVTEAVLKRLSE